METFMFLVIVHTIADFVFQDEQWAKNKSKRLKPLLAHTTTYSLLWFLPVWVYAGDLVGSIIFTVITFIVHTITDFITSKIVADKFAKGEYGSPIPNNGAFTMIGYDQLLHFIQLGLTYHIIFGPF